MTTVLWEPTSMMLLADRQASNGAGETTADSCKFTHFMPGTGPYIGGKRIRLVAGSGAVSTITAIMENLAYFEDGDWQAYGKKAYEAAKDSPARAAISKLLHAQLRGRSASFLLVAEDFTAAKVSAEDMLQVDGRGRPQSTASAFFFSRIAQHIGSGGRVAYTAFKVLGFDPIHAMCLAACHDPHTGTEITGLKLDKDGAQAITAPRYHRPHLRKAFKAGVSFDVEAFYAHLRTGALTGSRHGDEYLRKREMRALEDEIGAQPDDVAARQVSAAVKKTAVRKAVAKKAAVKKAVAKKAAVKKTTVKKAARRKAAVANGSV